MSMGDYFRMTYSSPDCLSTCLIHRLSPLPELLELPPLVATCAISRPFPTGRNTERTSRRDPSSTTLLHLKLDSFLELAFLHTKTAPRLLSFATLNTPAKSLCRESTTIKSMPASPSITSSASPIIISGDIPASPMASSYCDLDSSSGTIQTCLPSVWRLAMARPILVARIPPCDHVSSISLAFHPAAMAEISSATLDSWWTSHCKQIN